MPKTILFGLLLISSLFFSCKMTNQSHEIAERTYIKSYELLENECLKSFRKVMKPSGMEQAGFAFKKAFLLDVALDTLFHEKKEFEDYIFVGFEIEDDSIEFDNLQIFAISLGYGEIYQCSPLKARNSLIVNKNRVMFNNTAILLKGSCFKNNIDFCDDRTETTIGIWEKTSKGDFYGEWLLGEEKTDYFENEYFNKKWSAKGSKIYFLSKESNDTIASSDF